MVANLKLILVTALVVACRTSGIPSPALRAPSPPTQLAESPQLMASRALPLLLGDRGPQLRQQALELYMTACRSGHGPSCAVVLSIGGDGFTDDQQWEASEVLWPRCMGGDPWSCRIVQKSSSGFSFSDLPKARDACTRGFAYACTSVAIRTEDNDLLGKACEMGDPKACVGVQKVDSPKRVRWAERAQALFLRGCDAGLWEDCISLGTLPEGPLRTAVEKRGYALAVASCIEADSRACDTIHRFDDKSIELRLRTVKCALGLASCRHLAEFYLAGSVMHNEGLARLAYEMSCLADPPGSIYEWKRDDCVAGAKLSREIDDDGVRADVMSKRACSLGEATACTGKVGGTP